MLFAATSIVTFSALPTLFSQAPIVPYHLPGISDSGSTTTNSLQATQQADRDALCIRKFAIVDYSVNIIMDGWGHEDAGCGRGLLDNLRTQCGVVTDWQCLYHNENQAIAAFELPLFIRNHCIEDAIWLASGPNHITTDC
jgi:hypothetical protein